MKYASDGTPVRRSTTGWSVAMGWHDLLFMHLPIDIERFLSLIPEGSELDLFEDQAWIGVIPFHMSGIRHRLCPPIPTISAFPELNVRTYVKARGQAPGVWFFSLDAAHRLAVRTARRTSHLPYFDAEMFVHNQNGGKSHGSHRTHRSTAAAQFEAVYYPVGDRLTTDPGSLEHWLTARYCLYSQDRRGCIRRGDIDHDPWQLRRGCAEVTRNTMTE